MNLNNLGKRNYSLTYFFPALLLSFFLFSCGDEAGTFGLDILPDADKVEALYTDTFSLTFETIPGERFYSGNGRYGMVGGYHDPFFGYTEASFAMEYYPMAYEIDSVKPVIDSLKIIFDVALVYGDTASPVELEIYTIENTLPGDSMFYSDFPIGDYNPKLLTTLQVKPATGTNTFLLSNEFGAKFLDYENFDLDSLYGYKDYFRENFPGLLFKAVKKDQKGSILNIDLLSNNTRLLIYYHESDRDTISGQITIDAFYSNPFNQSERYVENNVNMFSHDYTHASFSFSDNDNDSVIYLQSMGGAKVKAEIPALDNWIKEGEKVSIHSAELFFYRENFDKSYPIFKPCRQIGLRKINEEGDEERIEDTFVTASYFGGSLTNDYNYLPINITQYINQLANREIDNNGFIIYSSDNSSNYLYDYQTPGRVILTDVKNSKPPVLKIIYTRLD